MSISDIEFACDCGWTGLEEELSFRSIDNGYDSAGMPVYVNDSRCPACDGYATDGLCKIHTCRANYDYWEKKIARLKEVGGVLSVRQWSNVPYRSPQETIIDIPSEIVGVQKLTIAYGEQTFIPYIGDKIIHLPKLAANDGLNTYGFIDWFRPVFKKEKKAILDFAIIHFTDFRY
jgi:hypothetical protein